MPAGYGNFSVAGVSISAHRFSWELHHGPIPAGMFVCHRCDNPPCVRPDHMFLGTNADNNRDMRDKGRASGGARGEQNHVALLTDEAVRDIRVRIARGETQSSIASVYGVHKSTIGKVSSGKNWGHVT